MTYCMIMLSAPTDQDQRPFAKTPITLPRLTPWRRLSRVVVRVLSCALPTSFCTKMVDVMSDLQRRRNSSRVFHGKDGFITPRDLFRWADRKPDSYPDLAEGGYMLLGERLRQPVEQAVVREVLHTLLRSSVAPDALYARKHSEFLAALGLPPSAERDAAGKAGTAAGAVWIPSAVRIHSLVAACMRHDEPVLLVGDTGTGKTTVCQLYAEATGQTLHIINCHQHTETADFLGGLRPARGRAFQVAALAERVQSFEASISALAGAEGAVVEAAAELAVNAAADAMQDDTVVALEARVDAALARLSAATALGGVERADELRAEGAALREEGTKCKALFVWEDGPLLIAMRRGEMLLIDEISLAEDAVLERLNSVLDPARILVLPEKGREIEEVGAAPGFRLLATMNPGGDFGKKELSPALRNRFTEVCPRCAHPGCLPFTYGALRPAAARRCGCRRWRRAPSCSS